MERIFSLGTKLVESDVERIANSKIISAHMPHGEKMACVSGRSMLSRSNKSLAFFTAVCCHVTCEPSGHMLPNAAKHRKEVNRDLAPPHSNLPSLTFE